MILDLKYNKSFKNILILDGDLLTRLIFKVIFWSKRLLLQSVLKGNWNIYMLKSFYNALYQQHITLRIRYIAVVGRLENQALSKVLSQLENKFLCNPNFC